MPITKGLDKLVKYNNRSIKDLTTTPAAAGGGGTGAIVHIKTLTASSSATLSFVHGTDGVVLDSTYPIYRFEFINMHPATEGVRFSFNLSIDAGSNYNVAKTTTYFEAIHSEGASSGFSYETGEDLAQGTGFQPLARNIGIDNDQCAVGEIFIFNPSSTTFVKHFIAKINFQHQSDYSMNSFVAGYGNTTSDVDAVQFKMDSGNIDSGTIKLYGIKDS